MGCNPTVPGGTLFPAGCNGIALRLPGIISCQIIETLMPTREGMLALSLGGSQSR